MVDTTNARAAAEGAGFGGTVYRDFEPFDQAEIYMMIGLLFVNGLSPRPRVEMWFEPHLIFGNDFIARAMDKQLPRGRRSIQGIPRWRHFRRFLCLFDFREDGGKETARNPL
jgi:hypothetical protein